MYIVAFIRILALLLKLRYINAVMRFIQECYYWTQFQLAAVDTPQEQACHQGDLETNTTGHQETSSIEVESGAGKNIAFNAAAV